MKAFFDELPAEIPIVVIDTETTGLHTGMGNRVVEIAAVRLEKWQTVGQMNRLVQPQRRMEAKAAQISGITDADLVDAPLFADVADELLDLIDGALLVAHNAAFDADFVGMELFLAGYGSKKKARRPIIPNSWLCTLLLARRFFHFDRYNLGHMAGLLGIRVGKAHRALNDVIMTVEVMKRIFREMEACGVHSVGDMLHAQGGAIYSPPPPRVNLPEELGRALSQKETVEILYMGKSGASNRIITPRYATYFKGVAYLIAWCHLRNDQRTFRVDRIFSISPTNQI